MASSSDVEKIRNAQRAQGPAAILAVGTTTPPNSIYQADFHDFYFRVTKSEHMVDLKEKLKLICEKSSIRKRHIHLTEEFLNKNPDVGVYNAPSLDTRHDVCVVEVPKLGHKAAIKAINEWGHPKSEITHLIFCTTSAIEMPGPDYQLTKLLGLNPSVKRHMIYNQGCFAGGTVLRLAKDLAENNKGARVLAVCCEVTVISFRGPNENQIDSLVGQVIFADAAGAFIVGSDPDLSTERPLFQIVSAAQTFLPDSDKAIGGQLKEVGLKFNLFRKLPSLLSEYVEKALIQAFSPLGITDWNSIFWIVHPGGRAILDDVELKLGLNEDKMRASRHVLSEYGNISSAAVLFIIDEMRNKSTEDGATTTGEGLDWGVMFGFGPGVTVETIALHSVTKVTKV